MSKKSLVAIALVLAAFAPVAPPAASGRDVAGLNLYLRRATFDPLRSMPQISSAMRAGPSSRLAIAQFGAAPTGATRAALAAAGLRPLVYIPDNALLVDAAGAPPSALAGLPGLRWYGPFQDAYKLPADLDSALNGQETADLDLRLLAAPGADVDGLAADLAARGGAVLGRGDGLNGASLRVRLPAASLRDVLRRDDVLWVERYVAPRVFNDKAREIVGVTAARQQLGWLTGAGQIVAVTDTGLDVQGGLSADFAGRVAAAFTPAQMSGASFCGQYGDPTTWSDRNGHGTHVAGTVLGSGALSPSGQAFAGVAPGARLVVQAVSTGGRSFDCLSIDTTFLTTAYGAGARVQNASWGGPTGGTDYNPTFGGYTQFASDIDSYLWNHKDHLLVVAAGNDGKDTSPRDGVIDADSIGQPATAKNVLTVGASESNRPPTGSYCFSSAAPESWCYSTFVGFAGVAPFAGDYIGDNINGIAAFSSRGPAADGRIKPEIVAPGTNIVSSASHDVAALYDYWYPGSDYAYDSGTSMAAPVVSGAAALVRQWLAQARQISAPSAALIKAMLLNGTVDLAPGQYGTGSAREIPAAWPNNVEGWGRANVADAVGLKSSQGIWLADNQAGLRSGDAAAYSLVVRAGQPLRLSLVWTDYPGFPGSGRALVNNLDLEVQAPDGTIVFGNTSAQLPADCRVAGADRCNNAESVRIDAPAAGVYVVRVRGTTIPIGRQPFALVGRAQSIGDRPAYAPTLQAIEGQGPALQLSWSAVAGATFYQVEESSSSGFTALSRTSSITQTSVMVLEDVGTYWFRVRACTPIGCGDASNARSATVVEPPKKRFFPAMFN